MQDDGSDDDFSWEHISRPLKRVFCALSFHTFTEPEAVLYFETVSCKRCGKKWCVNTRNQRVWEIVK